MGADLITLWVACDDARWPEIDWDAARKFLSETIQTTPLQEAYEGSGGDSTELSDVDAELRKRAVGCSS